jgi:4-amino-4-deoxy-L-arabinose transferase-like glycosyltransferase
MRRTEIIIILLALLKFVLPFLIVDGTFELHRDEYLYYEQGQHLDFGYLENPSLIGFLAHASAFLGGTYFWIKFWPALFGALTLLVTCKIAKELGGSVYAQIIAGLGILFSAYLRIHFLFQPNFLDIFFWTMSAYFLIRFCKTKEDKYLLLLCVSLALGWWSKYSVLFFIAAIAVSLLLTRYREVFSRKTFWMAVVLAVLIIIPNFLWQYFHKFPLVHHMEELRETQLRYLNTIDFLKEQLLMLFPVAFVWIGGLVWLLRNRQFNIVGLVYLFVILLLMLGSGKGYYSLGAYPMLIAAGGVWLEGITQKRIWLRYAFAILILLLSIPFVPILLPVQNPTAMAATNKKYNLEKAGFLKWEDQQNHALQQDFADMLGWKEITAKAERLYQQQPDAIKTNTVIYGADYGLAGGMKYYAKDAAFRNKVISENGTFLLWNPDSLYFKHLIYVDDEMPDPNDNVLKRFASMKIIDSCTNPYSRQYGTKIFFFQNATDSASIIAAKDIRDAKQKFNR